MNHCFFLRLVGGRLIAVCVCHDRTHCYFQPITVSRHAYSVIVTFFDLQLHDILQLVIAHGQRFITQQTFKTRKRGTFPAWRW